MARILEFCLVTWTYGIFLYLLCATRMVSSANYGTWDQVFTSESRSLEPSETLAALERLDDLFSAQPDDSSLLAKSKQIRPLIEASRVAFHKCSPRSFKAIDELKELYKMNTNTLVPYLEHYRLELFKFCEQVIAQDLELGEQDLSGVELHAITLLRDNVIESSNKKESCVHIAEHILLRALLEYMMLVSSDVMKRVNLDHRSASQIFFEKCKELPVQVCQSVNTKVITAFSIADILEYDINLADHIDSETFERLLSLQICKQILEKPDAACSKSYQLYLDELPDLNKKKKKWQFWKGKGRPKVSDKAGSSR